MRTIINKPLPLFRRMSARRPVSLVLRRPHHRTTRQRRAVLAALRATESHPTAEELYRAVRAKEPRVSLATVYRNLRVLVELGHARELPHARGQSRFDANLAPHAHITCTSCGQIRDIADPLGARFYGQIAKRHGVVVESHHVEFLGLCNACARRSAHSRPSGRAALAGRRG